MTKGFTELCAATWR